MLQAEELLQLQQDKRLGAPCQAEGRPNAYIPEALCIPKPYGGFSPFKPSREPLAVRQLLDSVAGRQAVTMVVPSDLPCNGSMDVCSNKPDGPAKIQRA